MRKFLLLSFTLFTLSCQSFNRPLFEEDQRILIIRQIYLEDCVCHLNNLKSECDEFGWDDNTSKQLGGIIEKIKWSIGYHLD